MSYWKMIVLHMQFFLLLILYSCFVFLVGFNLSLKGIVVSFVKHCPLTNTAVQLLHTDKLDKFFFFFEVVFLCC